MKKLNSCLILLPMVVLFFSACSDTLESGNITGGLSPNLLGKAGAPSPDNLANPYDAVGKVHGEILDAYFALSSSPTQLSGVILAVDQLAVANENFLKFQDGFYVLIDSVRAAEILTDSVVATAEIFDDAPMSSKAKISLQTFTDSFLAVCKIEQDYAAIYNYVTAYEALVLDSTTFAAQDKKVILTITSIARHSASKKRRPKKNDDTDWESNIFHIIGGIEGMSTSTSSAISTSVSLGIAGNR